MKAASRAFWILKVFGAQHVYVLNGTFQKWKNEKRKIESGDQESAWRNINRQD